MGGSANGSIAAGTYNLASIGIENPRCFFRNMDEDELTFEIKQTVTDRPALGYGETVKLTKTINGTSTVWFSGTVTKLYFVGNAKTETVRYVCSGPWYQFKRAIWQVLSQAYQPSTQTCNLASIKMSKVVLFQDPISGLSITAGQQITNIVTYALSIGIPCGIGTVPAFINVPFDETRDLTLSEAIKRCMQWTPDGVVWFNYTSGVGVLNAAPRSTMSAVSVDLAGTNLVEAFDLFPRYDLVPTGVRFNYVGVASCNVLIPNGCVDPTTGILNTGVAKLSNSPMLVQTIVQDNAGIPDSAGAILGTIDLTQLTPTTCESAPIGLAASYYASLLNPFWEGVVITHEAEVSGNLRPGKLLNLVNGATAWATMNAPIQQIEEDLFNGITRATFGTPQHLAPQTFAYLNSLTARRALVTSGLAAVNFPGSGGNSCPQGLNPATKKLLNTVGGSPTAVGTGIGSNNLNLPTCTIGVCSNGQLNQILVYCPNSS